jgi:hypothetical protein
LSVGVPATTKRTGLPRAVRERNHAEADEVVLGGGGRDQLDRAARQAEVHAPERVAASPVQDELDQLGMGSFSVIRPTSRPFRQASRMLLPRGLSPGRARLHTSSSSRHGAGVCAPAHAASRASTRCRWRASYRTRPRRTRGPSGRCDSAARSRRKTPATPAPSPSASWGSISMGRPRLLTARLKTILPVDQVNTV